MKMILETYKRFSRQFHRNNEINFTKPLKFRHMVLFDVQKRSAELA